MSRKNIKTDDLKGPKLRPPQNSKSIDFRNVGGLNQHLQTLREVIIFPLIYKEVYARFNVKPPRGVLFYGPPGTGKTLLAKALAEECPKASNRAVKFFSRKGSDILDKWVGESEKRLRTLFEQAYQSKPSIIFFDEIDALAPVRSCHQDHVHTGVVATLLTLMDGLDLMPGVIVIGATNRLSAIDPALRRAGRFDREIYFPLPTQQGRLEILEVHTRSWEQKVKEDILHRLAKVTNGFSGADLQALCSDTVLNCVKRVYPNIENLSYRINVDAKKLEVTEEDFMKAHMRIIPTSKRCRIFNYRLTDLIKPLLNRQMDNLINLMTEKYPHFLSHNFRYVNENGSYNGQLLLIGKDKQGHQEHIAPALLHHLEHLAIHVLDIETLYESGCSLEENIIQKFRLAQQAGPGIIYTPAIDKWFNVVSDSVRVLFTTLLTQLSSQPPVLVIGTSSIDVPSEIHDFVKISNGLIVSMQNPNQSEREQFFAPIFLQKPFDPPLCLEVVKCESDLSTMPNKTSQTRRRPRTSRRLKGLQPCSSLHVGINDGETIKSKKRKQISPPNSNYELPPKRSKLEKGTEKDLESLEKLSNELRTSEVKLSRPKLMALYKETVVTTENANCGSLEMLYGQMERAALSCQHLWDRNILLDRFQDLLNEFQKQRKEN